MHTVYTHYGASVPHTASYATSQYQSGWGVEGREMGGVVPRRECSPGPWYNARGKSEPEHAAHGVPDSTE
eukprot:1155766-Rhodomonas_salina.1